MSEPFLRDVNAFLDQSQMITNPSDMAGFLEDWRGNYKGDAAAILLPRATEEVSKIMAAALKHWQLLMNGGSTSSRSATSGRTIHQLRGRDRTSA